MLRHYIVQALRSLWRFRVTAAVNLSGLVLALACFIVTYLFLDSTVRSDTHFPKASRIYAITQELWTGPGERMIAAFPRAGPPVAKHLRAEFPALEAVARALPLGPVATAAADRKTDVFAAAVDPDFLRIFDLDFRHGEAQAALTSAHSAVFTEDAAERLFGTTEVIGRRLLLQNRIDVTVTAVIAPVRQPSHMGDTAAPGLLRFDILLPMDLVTELNSSAGIGVPIDPDADQWGNDIFFTYALLPEDGSLTADELIAGLGPFGERRAPQEPVRSVFGAVPVSHISLAMMDAFIGGGAISLTTSIFLLDALILAIACLNYANLAVAIATTRAKEVGMRKVLGASRFHLIRQYLVEAALLAGAAILIVLALVALAIAPLNDDPGIELQLSRLLQPGLWALVAALIGAVTLIGGVYPALVLSRVPPVQALRTASVSAGPRFVPTILVGIQFGAASFLLVVALLMAGQNRTLQRVGIQPDRDPVVVINNNLREFGIAFDTLRSELLRDPGIVSVSASSSPPWQDGGWHVMVRRDPGAGPTEVTIFNQVSYDFFETLGLRWLAGRALDREHGDEIVSFLTPRPPERPEIPIVIDRSLAAALGWSDPNDAVNQPVYDAESMGATPRAFRVVGVVEDGYPRLVGPNTESNMYGLVPEMAGVPLVRVSRNEVSAALSHIDSVWESLVPNAPVRREFMDALFDAAYETFARMSSVLSGLAAFAFFIAIMGLCGLAIHVTSRRQREIGIRKTLGASVRGVVLMLLVDFAKPVLVANLLAWPLAWFAGQAYLNLFVQRSALTPWPFVLSLVITVGIAWAAVAVQALRAASVKPANVLYAQ